MDEGRRNFIRYTGILAAGIVTIPSQLFAEKNKSVTFTPRLGICTDISNSQILIDAKFSYIEESVRGFLVPDKAESVFSEKLQLLEKANISLEACNSFLPGELKSVGAETKHKEILVFAETAFQRAERAGIKTIVFGSGGSRAIPEGFSREEAEKQFIDICKKIAFVAKKYNIVISLEPLNSKECNFINSVSEAGEIVKKVDHPNFRLLADIYHMLMENEGPESIVKYGKYLYHVHIAEKEGRSAPGTHGEDFTPYFLALNKVGYKGRISIECRWDDLETQSGMALLYLKNQLEKI